MLRVIRGEEDEGYDRSPSYPKAVRYLMADRGEGRCPIFKCDPRSLSICPHGGAFFQAADLSSPLQVGRH